MWRFCCSVSCSTRAQADADMFATCSGTPDKSKAPHAYRWFIHIATVMGVRRYIIMTLCFTCGTQYNIGLLMKRVTRNSV